MRAGSTDNFGWPEPDGKMQVFTSSGAGTWGPPLRLGSNPEIVVLQFE